MKMESKALDEAALNSTHSPISHLPLSLSLEGKSKEEQEREDGDWRRRWKVKWKQASQDHHLTKLKSSSSQVHGHG
jgi:hypothetical protein